MHKFKNFLIDVVAALNSLGFSLIVGSVVYFILGTVAELVHSSMLDWTFCGSAHHLLDVEWCGVEGSTGEPFFDNFVHRLLNAPLPWFMIFWGFVLTGVSTLLLKLLGHQYVPPGRRKQISS